MGHKNYKSNLSCFDCMFINFFVVFVLYYYVHCQLVKCLLTHWLLLGHVPYVLVGAGTASFAAAKAIRQKDPQAKVLIIGKYINNVCIYIVQSHLKQGCIHVHARIYEERYPYDSLRFLLS